MTEEYKDKLPETVLKEFEKIAEEKKLTKAQKEEILNKIKETYDAAKIHPGEAIGVITAESFGEPGTQMTLNVFHFAGVAEVSVSTGLPRIIELFDARKIMKTPMMEIHLTPQYNKDPLKVKKIASSIKTITLKEISSNFSLNIVKLSLEIKLNKKAMRERGISENLIIEKIGALKNIMVKLNNDVLTITPKDEEINLKELYKLKEKIKELQISGIVRIKQVLLVKNGNEFIIITAGSNLKEVLRMKEVDSYKTITNDIFEIRSMLGIEAARSAIITEAKKIYEDQGLDVDIRHMMFIADIITTTGKIKGITRSGITSEKESVLARATFETPIKHIINASLFGEEDNLNSVIENVILNQPVPLGTGLPDLVIKMEKKEK